MKVAKQGMHLTLSDRIIIESELKINTSAIAIAQLIDKDPTTVSKEIKSHRTTKQPNFYNQSNNNLLDLPLCQRQTRFPHVCNGCDTMKRRGCRKLKHFYSADIANQEYNYSLSDSRKGYDISVHDLIELDNIISPLILNGHSLYHIKASNKDAIIPSERTLYRYTADQLFSCRDIDLPRKVRYTPRKKHRHVKPSREAKQGRMYDDYLIHVSENDCGEIVQLDTVEGLISDSKCLLTIMFTHTKLMLIRLLPKQRALHVTRAFNALEAQLQSVENFKKLFGTILTDNGSEFSDILGLEYSSKTGEKRSDLFFCDPMRSDQKGTLEKNHEHIRSIIPKGHSMDKLTKTKVSWMETHINSYRRKSLQNKTPYEMFEFSYGAEICSLLRLTKVDSNDVILKPKLIK